MTKCKHLFTAVAAVCLPVALHASALAQDEPARTAGFSTSAAMELPDAPQSQADAGQAQSQSNADQTVKPNQPGNKVDPSLGNNNAAQKLPPGPYQTKRILGIVPNFRSVSADVKLPAQTAGAKYKTAFQESFDYSAFIFVGIQAGISQATDSFPEFHQGAAGYGRYYWHTFLDTLDENMWVQGILPGALHHDSRYYTLGHGGPLKRAAYSFTRTLITRTDEGSNTFNVDEVVGAGAASGISCLYYPSQYQTWTKTGQRWLTNVIIDGGTFVAREFWPDINSAVFHQKQ